MKNLSGKEIRRLYKQFYADRGHLVFPSASLVPHNDPTLLWINAGMAPLKPYFDGREIPEKPRIVSSQKCIRTNDIEEVGKTARHQTFFEMLGNFSFGDYFKREAITWAWEFLTNVLELDANLLSVTIHVEDDEAYHVWHDEVGLPDNRIFRGEEDNFWEIGEGPCGPCSEIFYDRGIEFGCGSDDCKPGCDCDRFLEIWNLVFTQYNKEADGTYTPLPKKNIDTGSGLERVASVLQNVTNNFETDLFRPIIDKTAQIAKRAYGQSKADDMHFKIIADHLRTVAFAIGDGVLPGNEGRSYIIRRLLRRGVRSGRRLGIEKPFMYELATVVAKVMGEDYTEVKDKLDFIQKVVKTEEERFHETLVEGETLLLELIASLRQSGGSQLAGEDAFRLYDTFGFPIDLTIEIAEENGVTVDREGFNAKLEDQRVRARAARHTSEGMSSDRGVLETITTPSQFVGYSDLYTKSKVTHIFHNGESVDTLQAGEEGQLLLDTTPFYAESGGQVSDTGEIIGQNGKSIVKSVGKAPHGQHLHTVKVISGELQAGDQVEACVYADVRKDTIKNHTATHLLHKALREVLGEHVAQAGSLVAPERLRFDFSHFGSISKEELYDIEKRVNDAIWRDYPVVIEEMDIDDAKKMGAMALFGEKYGKRVRVVQAGDYSIELCGGCHVSQTGFIGQFIIQSETGIGSGTRRIEAVTGRFAYQEVQANRSLLDESSELLRTTSSELPSRINRTLEEIRTISRELESAKAKMNHNRVGALLDGVKRVGDIPVVASIIADTDMDGLRQLVDEIRTSLESHVIVLGCATHDKVQFVSAVSGDLQKRKLHAGNIIKQVAAITGGSGGGRPDMASAGGKDANKLESAIFAVYEIVQSLAGIKDGITN